MLSKLGRHARHNAVAYLALFVALGGTSFAAATVITGKNVKNSSLTSADVKNSSLTGTDVKNSSLTGSDIRAEAINSDDVANGSLLAQDFGAGQLPAGPPGPKGDKGDAGAPGEKGLTGDPGPITGDLPSGVTLRGGYAVSYPDGNLGATNPLWSSISFGFRLPSVPTNHVLAQGATTPECQGTVDNPEAAPGHLCIYRDFENGLGAPSEFSASAGHQNRTGAWLAFGVGGTSVHLARGSWAVTAP